MRPLGDPCTPNFHSPDPNGRCLNCGWEVTSTKTDLDAPIPQPGDPLTQEQMGLMHPGSRVADGQGDLWVKLTSGEWQWGKATLCTRSLYLLFGPIELYESSI